MLETPSEVDTQQCGGTHYKMCPPEYQHWNLVTVHGWDYFQAQIIKYVMRFREKGGVHDLKKAQHFLSKLIELEEKQKKEEEEPLKEGTAPRPPNYGYAELKKSPHSNESFTYEGGTKDYDLWRCRVCLDHFETPIESLPEYYHHHDAGSTASYVDQDR